MKKTALVLAGLLGSSGLYAQGGSSYSVTLDFPYVSEYVFRGISLADDSVQPSIEYATGNLYAGIWSSLPVTGGFTNEFDFYAGYGLPLSETWALDFGATYYYYPQTPSGDEQFEPFVGLTGELPGGFSTSVYGYYETKFEVATIQGSIGYSMPLSEQVAFDLSATLGHVDPRESEGGSYSYWGAGGVFTYQLRPAASAYLGFNYATNDLGGEFDDNFFFVNTGVTIGF